MRSNWKSTVTIALASACCHGLAAAQDFDRPPPSDRIAPAEYGDRRPGKGRRGPPGMDPMASEYKFVEMLLRNERLQTELEISDEQVRRLRAMHGQFTERMTALQKRRRVTGRRVAELLSEREPDRARIMAAVEEAGAVNVEIAKLGIANVLDMREVLEPEQIARAKKTVHELMRRRRSRDAERPAPRDAPPRRP